MSSCKKYATRLRTRNSRRAIDKLRTVFESLGKFLEVDYNDEEKEALKSELDEWVDGQVGLTQKVAQMLMKHLVGEELEQQAEEEEEETSTAIESSRLEEQATPLKMLEETAPLKTTESAESHDETAQLATAEILEETAQLETPEIRRRKTMKFAAKHDVTPLTTTMGSSQFSSSLLSNTSLPSRRTSRSSIDLAQMILRRTSILDKSVVCLGTPARSPIEVITLDTSPEATPVKASAIFSDAFKNRRSEPMSLSSPQSPWPAADA